MRTEHAAGWASIARIVQKLPIPVIVLWVVFTVGANIAAPQIEAVAKAHSVSLSPNDAPSLVAMKRIGKDFQQFDSDNTVMVVLEGQSALGDEAHRYYDALIARLSRDTAHVEHIDDFWGDRLTAAGSQSVDGKAAYVQLYLTGGLGSARANDAVAAVQRIVQSVPPPPGLKAYVTGPGALGADQDASGNSSLQKLTAVTIAVITIVLLIAYRSLSTVLTMLLTVGIELLAARGAIASLAVNEIIGLSTFAINVLTTLTIAASTDYIIFLVGRYQEARTAGQNRELAYYSMFGGTAHVV
ncbi:MMPL family transporter, partial [Mycobacterium basiliense]